SEFCNFVKISIVMSAPAPSDEGHASESRRGVHERFHDFFRQEDALVTFRIDYKLPHGVGIAGPVRRKYGIQRKAVERLVFAKHVAKKIRCFLNPVLFRLIINYTNPGTDT